VSNQIISDHGDRDSSRGEQGEQSLDQARLATAYRPSNLNALQSKVCTPYFNIYDWPRETCDVGGLSMACPSM
jgi:hypothetical protein